MANPNSSAQVLDGNVVSRALIDNVHEVIEAHVTGSGRRPGLAVIMVGDDPASAIYVRAKRRDCERAGIIARDFDLPHDTRQEDLLYLVDTLNADSDIDGILVQLPLPPHIDETAVTNRIRSSKDVDGFHAFSVGRLALRQPGLRPCTPRGVMTLLRYYGIDAKGMHAVVVGASNIVGRPMSLELLLEGATVTVCHRFTRNLERHVRMAEILVAAVGKRGVVDAAWLPEGVIAVDVGINRDAEGKLAGDLDFEAAARRAAWITPVPGGVGPMTRATLMQNTAEASGLVIPAPART